ncbi:MAG: carbon-phosphorus lyase complex subunit PhnI [Rhizobiales bacterium NRL2]|jgi:alpha-D-ribose 1-methylphosphonate 5-triphosphate synthase subunit PhnI|nr:MAG: carbon-phosphorus lyase complex subunit PhnI [Rhizobiales bacterium NRL2]
MYVAVKGGEKAIENAHDWLDEERRGDPDLPRITPEQIEQQLRLAVDRVMTEGSLHDRKLAALAIRQARGDQIEAIFLLRAYRTTLPRFGEAEPIDTGAMRVKRRISSTFKDLPGGQVLGPTFDYTHRLIDVDDDGESAVAAEAEAEGTAAPRVINLLDREGLIEAEKPAGAETEPADITRAPLEFPAGRDARLQRLARGDEGYLLALGYSTQRGYSRSHPFAGEIRHGAVAVEFAPPELGFPIEIGEIDVTECQMITQFSGSETAPPQFTQGYGLTFGFCERKAMAMALVDRALRASDFGEEVTAPAQDEEFVLAHCDNVQATGFVEHLKLPHYVDFQSELELVRKLRREHAGRHAAGAGEPSMAAE